MDKVKVYNGVLEGDFVVCTQCGKKMLLPYGADQCPECYGYGSLDWADESQESNTEVLKNQGYELEFVDRDLKMEDYLDPETLAIEYPDYYETIHDPNY